MGVSSFHRVRLPRSKEPMKACPGVSRLVRPVPEYIACPNCGEEVEIWSDEEEATCDGCGAIVSRKMVSCLDWCEHADKCRALIEQMRLVRKG